MQQRIEIAKSRSQTDEFTRWDAPWWEMSDEVMADSLRKTNGEVIISFREQDQISGVDLKGKVLVGEPIINAGIKAIAGLGADILRESKLHPSVLAKIPVDTELISKLREHPLVDIFEPNVTGRYLNITWNIDRVNAPDVWNQTTGSGAKLLIIDSGIDTNHLDLNPAVVNSCDNTNGVDQFGHGTHVAGIAAALQNSQDVVGVAHGAELWSVKVGTTAPVPDFVRCAVEFGRINNVDVMNMSLSITSLSSLTDEINAAYNQDDIVLVAAAGNTSGGAVTYPANLNTVIAVTATDNNNNRANFAAIGPEIELAAPGVNIESTCLGGGTCMDSGTSMAAPHVAGAAALLRSYNSSWSNSQIRQKLNDSAQSISGSSNEVGNGLLDIEAAIAPSPISINVNISGPSNMFEGSSATFTASASGGEPPYNYQWYYRHETNSNWTSMTTGSQYIHTAGAPNGEYVRVVATDSNMATNEDTHYFTILGWTLADEDSLITETEPADF